MWSVQRTRTCRCFVLGFAATILIFSQSGASLEIEQVGNAPDSLQSSAGSEAHGVTFLIKDAFKQSGTVFAFKAYIRNADQARLQMWRPVSDSPNNTAFKLFFDYPHNPKVTKFLEPIYLYNIMNTKTCVLVQPGDRLGLFFENSSSISYVYTSDPQRSVVTFAHLADANSNKTYHELGDTVSFDEIVFPYDFIIAAYYYIDKSDAVNLTGDPMVGCVNEIIPTPQVPTLPPPVKGITGAPGVTGPMGYTGDTGDIGVQGPHGVIGLTGPIGTQGELGVRGENGSIGDRGFMGQRGPMGGVGWTGATGATGQQGATGNVGPSGIDGVFIVINETDTYQENLQAAADVQQTTITPWPEKRMMVGVVIWLSVLSFVEIIFIIVLIILTCFYCRRRRDADDQKKDSLLHSQPVDTVDGHVTSPDVEMSAPTTTRTDGFGTISAGTGHPWSQLREESTIEISPEVPVTFGPAAGRQVLTALSGSQDTLIKPDESTTSRSSSPPPYEAETTNDKLSY